MFVDRVRALVESARVSAAVVALLDLALPWWHHTDGTVPATPTGWVALSSSEDGASWFLVFAVVVSTATVLATRRRLQVIAAVLTGLSGLAMLISAANRNSLSFVHPQVGVWFGGALGLLLAVLCASSAALTRPLPAHAAPRDAPERGRW